MGKFIDLTGKKFGRLTVIKRMPNNKFGIVYWLCECECGGQTIARGSSLRDGKTRSCGCLQKDYIRNYDYKKRKYKREYQRLRRILFAIKARCYNPHTVNFERYGGLGITVCDEWLDKKQGTLNFCKWAMENGYSENLTIDRINSNGNYEPSNCRWVDYTQQCRNRKITLKYTVNGINKPLKEWCDLYNIKYSAVLKRLKRGWDIEKALTVPLRVINYSRNFRPDNQESPHIR